MKHPPVTSKYKNRKTEVDGITFDSKREAARYSTLKLLQRAGHIRDLELQPVFPIVINGVKICKYKADFQYFDITAGKQIVEDCKGFATREYKLKKKLVRAVFGVEIVET
jgi:hypothetical protein